MSLREVAPCTGHKVLMEVDNNILLIVGDQSGILDNLLGLHPIYLLNIIFILVNYIKLFIIKLVGLILNLGPSHLKAEAELKQHDCMLN
jgi:hypothetical protein